MKVVDNLFQQNLKNPNFNGPILVYGQQNSENTFWRKMGKIAKIYNYANFTTIWTKLTEITPRNLHAKFQINWTCSFWEKFFLTKNGKNCPKNTFMQISPQFEQNWQRSPLPTSILSFKSIGLKVSDKKIIN